MVPPDPSHYGWKQPQHLDELARQFEALQKGSRPSAKVTQRFTPGGKMFTIGLDDPQAKRSAAKLESEVRRILAALDREGRWVTAHDGVARLVGQPKFAKGFRYLASNVFNYHVEVLSDYIAATAMK